MKAEANPHEAKNLIEEYSLPNLGVTVHLKATRLHRVKPCSGWSYPNHEHMQYEINLMTQGDMIVFLDGKRLECKEGDLLLIKPGMNHSLMEGSSAEFSHFFMHFDIDDTMFLPLLQCAKDVLYPAESLLVKRVRPTLDRMIALAQIHDPKPISDRMRFHSAVFELFAGLGDSLQNIQKESPSSSLHIHQMAYEIAEKIKQVARNTIFYDKYGSERAGIDDIAKEVGISTSHCNRIFRTVYGMSPRHYLSELKLKEAKRLLSTDLQIEHISKLLGYRDISHFSQQFKRWTGQPPSRFRLSINTQS
jgi:AraC-like DNA-binding protein